MMLILDKIHHFYSRGKQNPKFVPMKWQCSAVQCSAVCNVNCVVVGGGQECIYQEFIVEAEGGPICPDILGDMGHLSLDTAYV